MDEHLEKATEFGDGIRILKQDGWEMLISFIISSNNRIPMIQKAINNLSREFGTYIGEYNGKEYYAFPTPEQLSKASQEQIKTTIETHSCFGIGCNCCDHKEGECKSE